MSDNDKDSTQSSRRTLLKAVGAGALAGITIGTGNAAADGAEPMKFCGMETKCEPNYPCDEPGSGGRSMELERECCTYSDGSTSCGPWSASGCC